MNVNKTESQEELFKALGAPLPEDAEQHMDGADTHKGYDADGYKCQYIINRFNDVLGNHWGFDWIKLEQKEGTWGQKKTPCYDLTVEIKIWIINKENIRSCVGGHISGSYNDALSGAITNGFKRAARFWGVGRQAYEGILGSGTGTGQQRKKSNSNRNKNNNNQPSGSPTREKKNTPPPVSTPTKEVSIKGQYYETVNKMGLNAASIQEYKKYLNGLYGTDDAEKFSDERIKDQLEVLAVILAKYENKTFIERAVRELSNPHNDLKDSSYARPIKIEIGRIMKGIYGGNLELIMANIAAMTTRGLTDLDKMNLLELYEVLGCSNILLAESLEAKKG